jgi:hypothetical protein
VVRQERGSYDTRFLTSGGDAVRVTLRPRGSELRDLVDRRAWVTWASLLPGLISIIGWVLHHTAYRSRWLVTVEPADPTAWRSPSTHLRLAPMGKRDADRAFLALVDWIDDGRPLQDFSPTAVGGTPPE